MRRHGDHRQTAENLLDAYVHQRGMTESLSDLLAKANVHATLALIDAIEALPVPAETVQADPGARAMTIQQAASAANVNERTIRRLIADGKLPATRVGAKAIRIDRRDFDAVFKPVGGGQ